ncbi:MAG TPA: response regulator [Methylomirabilota bacterium]|nr:response regulator [Methylomirabilota bacterium]
MHVLLVEDHLPTLDALKALLQRSGCEVTTASSVKLALECARSGRFNGVLSDVGLPDGSGLELMRQLRDEHGLTGIALSGYGMEEDVLRSKESGFVAHLTKPVRAADLRQAILLHFGKSPTNAHKPD